eukprot:m51a1_g3423 hypothetical protein (1265) ;mRNA; f:599557-604034
MPQRWCHDQPREVDTATAVAALLDEAQRGKTPRHRVVRQLSDLCARKDFDEVLGDMHARILAADEHADRSAEAAEWALCHALSAARSSDPARAFALLAAQRSSAPSPVVRLRCCRALRTLLGALAGAHKSGLCGLLGDDVCPAVESALCRRAIDTKLCVRLQAVGALAHLQERADARGVLREALAEDVNESVRLLALEVVRPDESNAVEVLLRARDKSPSIRELFFRRLCDVPAQCMQPVDHADIVLSGLTDPAKKVRAACTESVLKTLGNSGGDVVELFRTCGLASSHQAALAVVQMLSSRCSASLPKADSLDISEMCRRLPVGCSVESAELFRCYVEVLDPPVLDAGAQETQAMCETIEAHVKASDPRVVEPLVFCAWKLWSCDASAAPEVATRVVALVKDVVLPSLHQTVNTKSFAVLLLKRCYASGREGSESLACAVKETMSGLLRPLVSEKDDSRVGTKELVCSLEIAAGLLSNAHPNASIDEMVEEVVEPCTSHKDPRVKRLAVKCMGIYCSSAASPEHMGSPLFSHAIQLFCASLNEDVPLKKVAARALFDVWLSCGPDAIPQHTRSLITDVAGTLDGELSGLLTEGTCKVMLARQPAPADYVVLGRMLAHVFSDASEYTVQRHIRSFFAEFVKSGGSARAAAVCHALVHAVRCFAAGRCNMTAASRVMEFVRDMLRVAEKPREAVLPFLQWKFRLGHDLMAVLLFAEMLARPKERTAKAMLKAVQTLECDGDNAELATLVSFLTERVAEALPVLAEELHKAPSAATADIGAERAKAVLDYVEQQRHESQPEEEEDAIEDSDSEKPESRKGGPADMEADSEAGELVVDLPYASADMEVDQQAAVQPTPLRPASTASAFVKETPAERRAQTPDILIELGTPNAEYLAKLVAELGGIATVQKPGVPFEPRVTHVIAHSAATQEPSDLVAAALLSRRWVLPAEWLVESARRGEFVPEEECGGARLCHSIKRSLRPPKHAGAPKREEREKGLEGVRIYISPSIVSDMLIHALLVDIGGAQFVERRADAHIALVPPGEDNLSQEGGEGQTPCSPTYSEVWTWTSLVRKLYRCAQEQTAEGPGPQEASAQPEKTAEEVEPAEESQAASSEDADARDDLFSPMQMPQQPAYRSPAMPPHVTVMNNDGVPLDFDTSTASAVSRIVGFVKQFKHGVTQEHQTMKKLCEDYRDILAQFDKLEALPKTLEGLKDEPELIALTTPQPMGLKADTSKYAAHVNAQLKSVEEERRKLVEALGAASAVLKPT